MFIKVKHFSIKGWFWFCFSQNKDGLGIDVDYSWDSPTNEAEPGTLPWPGQFKISMNAV